MQSDLSEAISNEESLFQTAIVPLKFNSGNLILWLNSKPNSSHFCRPLSLKYQKETIEVSKHEHNSLLSQISELRPIPCEVEGKNGKIQLIVDFKVDLTMFDGKVVNALTDTKSSQCCNICGAKPSDMNKIESVIQRDVNLDACDLGLSALHCWMRTFEYIIHISYKLTIKKHQARTPEEKYEVAQRKIFLQSEFREKMSLVVDAPKAVHGNSNDGNTARRAFLDPDTFASITGVDIDLIRRLKNVLCAVCSGYHLNIEKFHEYCYDTLLLIVQLYSWYAIPPTVHKLLVHGAQVADRLELPIGMYSEEAQESQNKIIRNSRLSHTCKISRLNVMKNQYHYMLIRTDPVISQISFVKHKSNGGNPLSEEVMALLL